MARWKQGGVDTERGRSKKSDENNFDRQTSQQRWGRDPGLAGVGVRSIPGGRKGLRQPKEKGKPWWKGKRKLLLAPKKRDGGRGDVLLNQPTVESRGRQGDLEEKYLPSLGQAFRRPAKDSQKDLQTNDVESGTASPPKAVRVRGSVRKSWT